MGKRFDQLVFPGGKSKAFTLSYDDGVVQDRRLAELFRQYGVKCTFNLGSGVLGHTEHVSFPKNPDTDVSKIDAGEVAEVYRTHEVAGHGLYHSALDSIGAPLANYEILEDKRRLEEITGEPLRMFAYPFGAYNDEVKALLAAAGYQGARTVRSTYTFAIPKDFLEWDPTCHHDDPRLLELAEKFIGDRSPFPALFYVWGHAYEFDGNDNWHVIEDLLKLVAPHGGDIWFATNGEIIEYVTAYRRLEYSVDGSFIRNPSAIDVEIRTSFGQTELIPAGKTVKVAATPL